jgi:uncharacterized protein (DUF1778 family)
MKVERLQVLVESEQRQRLEQAAAMRGTSVATLVREAIDLAFPSTMERKQRAAQLILNAPTSPMPNPDDLRRELDEIRGRRG